MAKVMMYATRVCPYCVRAEQLLRSKGIESIQKILIDQDPEKREEMMERTQRRTVPQIFIDDYHVGGCDDLIKLDKNGQLMPLLGL